MMRLARLLRECETVVSALTYFCSPAPLCRMGCNSSTTAAVSAKQPDARPDVKQPEGKSVASAQSPAAPAAAAAPASATPAPASASADKDANAKSDPSDPKKDELFATEQASDGQVCDRSHAKELAHGMREMPGQGSGRVQRRAEDESAAHSLVIETDFFGCMLSCRALVVACVRVTAVDRGTVTPRLHAIWVGDAPPPPLAIASLMACACTCGRGVSGEAHRQLQRRAGRPAPAHAFRCVSAATPDRLFVRRRLRPVQRRSDAHL
jgi:hypothetical protein